MKIVLLSQDKTNKSVRLLASHLEDAVRESSGEVCLWEVKDFKWKDDRHITNGEEEISLEEIAFVMKRTWGPIREKALTICQDLEKKGVKIINGTGFIEWSHSKIRQYEMLSTTGKKHLLSNTFCVDKTSFEEITSRTPREDIAEAIMKKGEGSVRFPMVLKKDQGCCADGVYLISSLDVFKAFVSNNLTQLQDGFLLQAFVGSHEKNEISNYFRINAVDGKVQSIVQFQLRWQYSDKLQVSQLVDFKEAEDKVIHPTIFPSESLKEMMTACPYYQEVVGIDVMFDGNKMYLLEYNDGPAISVVVDLGVEALKLKALSESQVEAAISCRQFAKAIADFCVEKFVPTPLFYEGKEMTYQFKAEERKEKTNLREEQPSSKTPVYRRKTCSF